MIPRVLNVEDDKDQREDIELFLKNLPQDQKQKCGVEEIYIDSVGSVEEAKELLETAVREKTPYDILLLDLSLPRTPDSGNEDPELGFEVLEQATSQRSVRRSMIISAFPYFHFSLQAMRLGATDFLKKPFVVRDLHERFMMNWAIVVRESSRAILERRVVELLPFAEKRLAYDLGACFTKTVQVTSGEIDAIASDLRQRFGSAPEGEDSLTRRLDVIRQTIRETRSEWKDLESGLMRGTNDVARIEIEPLLTDIRKELEPVCVTKNVALSIPSTTGTRVLSFSEDVKAILKEMVLGALLGEKGDSGTRIEIGVTHAKDAGYVEVFMKDSATLMTSEEICQVNEPRGIIHAPRLGRVWGLSVVQYVARRGGGVITAESTQGGNEVVYRVPCG